MSSAPFFDGWRSIASFVGRSDCYDHEVVKPEEIRRWARQRRLAAQRERTEVQSVIPDPAESFERGLRMVALVGRLHGWPPPETQRDRAQDLEVYLRWIRPRERLGMA